MYDLVISGARLADAEGLWSVGVKDGKISFVEPGNEAYEAKEQIEAKGRLLFPGMIDSHVHARDPGYTHKEDFCSVSMAAANGGVTTIMAMPNSNPPATNAAAAAYAVRRLKKYDIINIRLAGGALAACPGWMLPVVREGVIALDVYDDVFSYGTQRWIELFQEAEKAGIPLCFYLMDMAVEQLRRHESKAAGESEAEQIASATNGEAEAMSIARIFPVAAYFKVPVVIRMVSTAEAVRMIRVMRTLYPNAQVYAEVCVHYLFLTRDELKEQGGRAHIHPPLRTKQDVDGLWEGIWDGTIDYISSDHAPHTAKEKQGDFLSGCASGITGLETMLPLLLRAYFKGMLGLSDIQRLCCENPAKIYGLSEQKGSIRAGCDADLVLVDMDLQWTVRQEEFYTRGAPGPFEGQRMRGKPCLTVCGGRKVMENGTIIWNDGE